MIQLINFYIIGCLVMAVMVIIFMEPKEMPDLDDFGYLIKYSLWSWIGVLFLSIICWEDYVRIFKEFFKIK